MLNDALRGAVGSAFSTIPFAVALHLYGLVDGGRFDALSIVLGLIVTVMFAVMVGGFVSVTLGIPA
jgi:hypothetical protein